MTVMINGEARELEPGTTVTGLLESLGLHPRLIVVEHNRTILERASFDATEVRDCTVGPYPAVHVVTRMNDEPVVALYMPSKMVDKTSALVVAIANAHWMSVIR